MRVLECSSSLYKHDRRYIDVSGSPRLLLVGGRVWTWTPKNIYVHYLSVIISWQIYNKLCLYFLKKSPIYVKSTRLCLAGHPFNPAHINRVSVKEITIL